MAKKTEKAAIAAVVLLDAVTVSVALESVALDGEAPESVIIATLSKGVLMPDNVTRFQAVADGVIGKVAASVAAALNSLLDAMRIHPDAYVVPKTVKFAEIGGNEPKEAETFAALSAEEQDAMSADLTSFAESVSSYRDATRKSLAATLDVARALTGILSRFSTKKRKGIFVTLAGETAVRAKAEGWPNAADLLAVADMVTSKNVPGEFAFMAALPEELLALLPEGKASAKAVQAWVAGMRSEIAAELVGIVKRDAELSDAPLTVAFVAAAAEPVAFDAATALLFTLHLANLPDVALFDADASGKVSPGKVGGKPVTVALFGSEGSDELLKAFCACFNGYRTEAEKEADKVARDAAKPVASRDFATLPVGDVALHLFRILAGRIDESGEAVLDDTCSECGAIVAALGALVDDVASGVKTLADILSPAVDAPESEGDAEADADAAA